MDRFRLVGSVLCMLVRLLYICIMKYKSFIYLWLMFTPMCLSAQTDESQSLKDNWYVQLGLDMSLQNPYGHDFSAVFPNGKSFGVDVAVGRWFTPELGLRLKLNWENGLSMLENGHANWLAPFDQPGVNLDKGGYLVVAGDVQFDLHNLLYGFDPDRRWNMQLYPRAGMAYNCGVEKSTPLLGLGVNNTFRLSNEWSLYFDVAYNAVSSGFTGVEKETGIGSNSNGFLDLNVGVQWNLGRRAFSYGLRRDKMPAGPWKNGFWSNWFVQMGLDMTLQNPYGCNFTETFPKGKSFGLDLALGKWFSPEIGLRACLNWENGLPIFKNDHLEWIAVGDGSKSNMDDGGYVLTYFDVLLNLNTLFCGYNPERRGSVLFYPRAGLSSNRSTKSGSPLVGFGCEYIYRLNNRLSVFGDLAYQMTTSEFYKNVSSTGMSVSMGSNGFMDLELGVQWNLGK